MRVMPPGLRTCHRLRRRCRCLVGVGGGVCGGVCQRL